MCGVHCKLHGSALAVVAASRYVSKQYLDDVHCQSEPFKAFYSGYLVSSMVLEFHKTKRAASSGKGGLGAPDCGFTSATKQPVLQIDIGCRAAC